MRIGIGVQGRFHAFHLARELTRQGHEVVVLTNYPKFVCGWFGLPPGQLRTFPLHGVASRIAARLPWLGRRDVVDRWLHEAFGRWVARALREEDVDIVHLFSGVAEEALLDCPPLNRVGAVVRGSAHIRTQKRLLEEEEQRSGARLEKPTDWIVERETREYELADLIVVLSRFAMRSFIAEGVPADRLRKVSLGVETSRFRASRIALEGRARRIREGQPLRVLFVGTLSYRKGLLDLSRVIHGLAGKSFEFRLVGAIAPEARSAVRQLAGRAEVTGKCPEQKLPNHYAWGDVFLFPTIEDGFAAVLVQAAANGLPILATENCGAPDILEQGRSGWVVPIRRPDLLIERLVWCDGNREELAAMIEGIPTQFRPPDWSDMATTIAGVFQAALDGRETRGLAR